MFSRKKKKLTLVKMHELYLVLKDTLPENEEELLVKEIEKMMEKMTPEIFIRAITIMFGEVKKGNSISLAVLFVKGLKENSFFDYVALIRGLDGKQRQ